MKQTITRYACSGVDGDGQPTHSTEGETIACRIDMKQKKFIDFQGNEIITSAQIIVSGEYTININDRIVLPDGSEPIIQVVEGNVDADGNAHHTVVYT